MIINAIGPTLIVAGTAIGASMLALPIVVVYPGIAISILVLVLIWSLSYSSSIMMMKLDLNRNGKDLNIASIFLETFPSRFSYLFIISILLLFFQSLLSAYLTGGEAILSIFLPSNYLEIKSFARSMMILFIFSIPIIYSSKLVDWINRVLFFILLILFFIMVIGLIPYIKQENLFFRMNNETLYNKIIYLKSSIPIFFTSFGFHGSIPSLVHYCQYQENILRKSFFFGSLIPLIIYVIWIICIIGTIDHKEQESIRKIDDLILILSSKNRIIQVTSQLFSFLAIFTSFFGVGSALFQLILELIKNKRKFFLKHIFFFNDKLIAALLAFLPLVFLHYYQINDNFIIILDYSVIFLSILSLIIPSIITIKLNKKISFIIISRLFICFGLCLILLIFVNNIT